MSRRIFSEKTTYLITGILYSLFLYLIYQKTGFVTINEAEKYISAAKELLTGNVAYTFEHHLFYSSYILFITPFFAAGGIKGVIAAQIILNIVAAICLKKSVEAIFPSSKFSIVAMLIYLFSYPVQYWTLSLFSDNFFVAIISIALYYTIKKKKVPELFVWIFLLFILVFTRPPGIFLSFVFGFYYLYDKKIIAPTLLRISIGIVLAILFSALFYLPVETKGYIKPIAAGCIIVDQPDYDLPAFNNIEKSSLADAYGYLIKQNGLTKTITLYFRKYGSFFTLTRPYYSFFNNSILALHYLLYLLAFVGIWTLKNRRALLIMFISAIFLVGNLTALTYNEWHYRFTLGIFPFLITLSAVAIDSVINKIKPSH